MSSISSVSSGSFFSQYGDALISGHIDDSIKLIGFAIITSAIGAGLAFACLKAKGIKKIPAQVTVPAQVEAYPFLQVGPFSLKDNQMNAAIQPFVQQMDQALKGVENAVRSMEALKGITRQHIVSIKRHHDIEKIDLAEFADDLSISVQRARACTDALKRHYAGERVYNIPMVISYANSIFMDISQVVALMDGQLPDVTSGRASDIKSLHDQTMSTYTKIVVPLADKFDVDVAAYRQTASPVME